MKKNIINKVNVEGKLYSHKLSAKVTGDSAKTPGMKYITGSIDIATDDAETNIVTVNYTYEPEFNKNGNKNSKYDTLMNILNGTLATVTGNNGTPALVQIDGKIDLNDFYKNPTDGGTEPELVSAKRVAGKFIHVRPSVNADESKRAYFETDMVITRTSLKEADEEKGLPEKLVIGGAIFDDYTKAVRPIEFSVTDTNGINYFLNQDISKSNPMFTLCKGNIVSTTVVKKIERAGAWGNVEVTESARTRKDWVVNWVPSEPYAFNSEDTITVEELTQASADRETYLATLLQNYQQRMVAEAPTTKVAPSTTSGGFNF